MSRPLLLFAAASVMVGCGARGPAPRSLARRSGVYLWHDPVALTPADEAGMRALGLDDVYALVGTFSSDGERLVLRLRRRFERGSRRLYLVYRFDDGGGREALDQSPAVVADAIAAAYDEDRTTAAKAGWRVAGLQLDLDAPTRRLPEYAKLLRDVRARVTGELAMTGLLTWLDGRIELPLAQVDFWTPQFYDLSAPTEVSAVRAFGTVFARHRARLESLGVPFRPAVASFGRAAVYAGAKFDGLGRGLRPSEAAARFPALRVRPDGEERAAYRLPDGRTLLYRRPDPIAAAAALDAAARDRVTSGAVLFRLAAPGEETTPPLLSLRPPRATTFPIRVSAADEPSPFAAIERPGAGDEREITFSFRWTAPYDPPLRADAITIEVSFPPGRVSSLAPGDFGGLRLIGPARGTASLARAEEAVVRLPRLRSDAAMRLGPIRRSGRDATGRGILRVRATVITSEGPRTWEGVF